MEQLAHVAQGVAGALHQMIGEQVEELAEHDFLVHLFNHGLLIGLISRGGVLRGILQADW
jgi:hypothetical protein